MVLASVDEDGWQDIFFSEGGKNEWRPVCNIVCTRSVAALFSARNGTVCVCIDEQRNDFNGISK